MAQSERDRKKSRQSNSTQRTKTKRYDREINSIVYVVAKLAWEKGLGANRIVDLLVNSPEFSVFRDRHSEFSQGKKTSRAYTLVTRALQRAVIDGVLVLEMPTCDRLSQQLSERYHDIEGMEIRVEIDHEAACRRAAKAIFKKIEYLVDRSNGTDKRGDENQSIIYIANAGGRTVVDVIDELQRVVPLHKQRGGDWRRLCFLALNAAEAHDRFDQSANFCAVRMAQIFNGRRHFAVVKSASDEIKQEYVKAVQSIDFAVSSVGSHVNDCPSYLLEWLKGRDLRVPPNSFLGDLAFLPFDENGRPAILPVKATTAIQETFQPNPDWHAWMQLLRKDWIALVMTGAEKARTADVLFRHAIVHKCVIDAALAEAILALPAP